MNIIIAGCGKVGRAYPEDRQSVVDKIQALVDAGEYPAKLF